VLEAYYLGQRQGDCLVLPWIRYQADDKGTRRVRLRQSKTGTWIDVPATPWLADRLEQAAVRTAAIAARVEAAGGKPAPTIVVSEETGATYKGDNFRHVFAEVRELAVKGSNEHALQPCSSLADAWFMDLRDTAVTNLAAAGCTIPEICSITGHTERSAYEILKHYLALNGDMADAAIAKLVAYEERRRANSGKQ
jgi:hypothetical protein